MTNRYVDRGITLSDSMVPLGAALAECLVDDDLSPEATLQNNLEALVRWKCLAQEAGSYARLLSGSYAPISGLPEGQLHLDTASILHQHGQNEEATNPRTHSKAYGVNGFRDMAAAQRAPGRGSFDTYFLSLDITDPEMEYIGREFFGRVVAKALERDVLFMAASSVEDYALTLSTCRPHSAEMGKILQEEYDEFEEAGLFYATEHFFQGHVKRIRPQHLGFAQGPLFDDSNDLNSHAERMALFGREIDLHEDPIDEWAIIRAAAVAGIHPSYLYLTNPPLES